MTKAIHLQRNQDVNSTSGTGRVWEGVLFSNGWVAGKWNRDFSPCGYYPSLEHLQAIHERSGSTRLVFDKKINDGYYILLEASDVDNTTDGTPWIAEGFEFKDNRIVLLNLAKYNSVYWYRNIENLKKDIGNRSIVHRSKNQFLSFPSDSVIWKREQIFKTTTLP